MSIDKKRFEAHLFSPESSFEILIRGHLWMESIIDQFLAVEMADPSVLDLERMGFRQKVDIVQAFGFITPEDGRGLRELNRLRNKLAHDLSAEPGESDIRKLIDALGEPVKSMFKEVTASPEVISQSDSKFFHLRYWFFCYALHLDASCAMRKYRKENRTKIMQMTAFQVASEMYGGKKIPDDEARRRFHLADPPDPADSWR